MQDAESVENEVVRRLKDFTERLESGEPIRATQVTVEQTPDGPLTTRKEVWL